MNKQRDQKLKLIPLNKKYTEFLRLTRSHPEVNKYMSEDVKISKADQQKWYRRYPKDKQLKIFIVLAESLPVGYTQIRNIDRRNKSCELVFCIAPKYQGKGYGRQLCQQVLDYTVSQLKMHRIWLEVLAFNQRAINLYQGLGFTKEGILRDKIFKQGKFHDIVVMSLINK